MFDVIVQGGTLVDGTGAARRRADLGIVGGRIARIGDLLEQEATTTIDAAGLVVAPGFIDIHSHADLSVLVDPRACSAVTQGVTSIVIGNCGHAPAPLVDPADLPDLNFGFHPSIEATWRNGTAGRMDDSSAFAAGSTRYGSPSALMTTKPDDRELCASGR